MKRKIAILASVLVLLTVYAVYAAYNHYGDIDSAIFRSVYPDAVGTKLDSCTTCHRGSDKELGDPVTFGSCQWCHYITDYGREATEENLLKTLNAYGLAYKVNGRDAAALLAISNLDSDGDDYTNGAEILALAFPGDKKDTPENVPAPSRVLSLKELEEMPLHSQFLLMNASKSDDSYTRYSGVAIETLIKAIKLDSATGITVYSPDGFATYHPFNPSDKANSYHVFGTYLEGKFWYDERADMAIYPPDPPDYPNGGWCNYSSPSTSGRASGSVIFNPEGLKMLLAFKRDGQYLNPGVLNPANKLDGEGPFRVVPPQKKPGKPTQRSSSVNQDVIWPYNKNDDHNAGFSSRTVTIIKVEPVPEGTSDIDTLEAGWPFVDEEKIVIYGSIDTELEDNLCSGLDNLMQMIKSARDAAFKAKSSKATLVNKLEAIQRQVAHGAYTGALNKLKEDVLEKTDGCLSGKVDGNDWVKDLEVQKQLCSEIQKIWVLLVLIGA